MRNAALGRALIGLFIVSGFAGLIYFVFCFGMSRYSMMLEKRLDRGRGH